MKVSGLSNNGIISVAIDKIDFSTVLHLIKFMDIENVSVFADKGYEYTLKAQISVNTFLEYISQVSEPILLFDGKVDDCPMDEKINILLKKKILIDFNLSENTTVILINLQNANLSKKDIKKVVKQH